MPVLRTIHFEVHRVDDETRSEWKFIEWFMEVARRNQGRSFPALRTVAVHVFAARSAQMTVCGDWEYALFRVDDGPSRMEWRRWSSSVLSQSLLLRLIVLSPLPPGDETLRTAVHRRFAHIRDRLCLRIIPRGDAVHMS